MKNILALILALALCFALCANACATYEELYAKSTVVVELDYENDIVIVEDFNGNLWEFVGCEDWLIGDVCAMVMHNNGTPQNIYDDVIIATTYNGWID